MPSLDDLERLQKILVRTPHGVHVLSSPLAPDDAGALDSRRVGRLLSRLAALHQFVLVDTPVGLTELTAAALDVAELGLLVTTPEVPALRRTHACLRLLQGLEFPTNKLQLVLEPRVVEDAGQHGRSRRRPWPSRRLARRQRLRRDAGRGARPAGGAVPAESHA